MEEEECGKFGGGGNVKGWTGICEVCVGSEGMHNQGVVGPTLSRALPCDIGHCPYDMLTIVR